MKRRGAVARRQGPPQRVLVARRLGDSLPIGGVYPTLGGSLGGARARGVAAVGATVVAIAAYGAVVEIVAGRSLCWIVGRVAGIDAWAEWNIAVGRFDRRGVVRFVAGAVIGAGGHADDLGRGLAAGLIAQRRGLGGGGETGDGLGRAGERLGDDQRGAVLGDGAEIVDDRARAVGAGPLREVGEVAAGAVGDVEEREGGVEEVFEELELIVHAGMMGGGAGLARGNRASDTIERAGVVIGGRFARKCGCKRAVTGSRMEAELIRREARGKWQEARGGGAVRRWWWPSGGVAAAGWRSPGASRLEGGGMGGHVPLHGGADAVVAAAPSPCPAEPGISPAGSRGLWSIRPEGDDHRH